MLRRTLWTALAHGVALIPLAGGGDEPDAFLGAWVGGIELGDDFVPFALRIDQGAPAGSPPDEDGRAVAMTIEEDGQVTLARKVEQ